MNVCAKFRDDPLGMEKALAKLITRRRTTTTTTTRTTRAAIRDPFWV